MNQLDQTKKISPYIAGVACILYSIIGLIRGDTFIGMVLYIAILVLGVSCMIENAEIVGVIAVGVMAIFNLFSLISFFFTTILNFIQGYYAPFFMITNILALGVSFLKLISSVALLVLSVMRWKRANNFITKFWYAPAVVSLLSAFLTVFIALLNMAIFHYGISISYILNVVKTFAVNMLYVVAVAFVGISFYKNNYVAPVINQIDDASPEV